MNEEEKEAIRDLIDSSNISLIGDGTIITSNKTIKTILNLIGKLQKENEELKVENSKMRNIELASKNGMVKITLAGILDMEEKIKNSIPVQKVKDNIEEILNNKEYRIVFEGNAEFPDDATIINAQKYIKLEKMQELIKEREENKNG